MINAPSIGGGIFLGVVGAILAFAVSDQYVAGISLQMIGYICLAAAALMIVLGLVLGGRRTAPRNVHRTESIQTEGRAPTVRESHVETD